MRNRDVRRVETQHVFDIRKLSGGGSLLQVFDVFLFLLLLLLLLMLMTEFLVVVHANLWKYS